VVRSKRVRPEKDEEINPSEKGKPEEIL